MFDQGTFDFTAPPPPIMAGEVESLLLYLLNNPGFHTAREIAQSHGLSDRKIRQLAEAANGLIVSGPGSPGYCHLNHCPIEKSSHISATLISQGKAMIQRGMKIRRIAHTLIR